MEKVSARIMVRAPPAKVFAFLARPANLPKVIPLVTSASDAGGAIRAVVSVGGMDAPLDFRKVLWEKDRGIGLRAELYGAVVEIGLLLKPAKGGTDVQATIGYDVPASLAAFLPRDYKPRLEEGIDDSLRKLKAELERA